jgi:hypothetical protein
MLASFQHRSRAGCHPSPMKRQTSVLATIAAAAVGAAGVLVFAQFGPSDNPNVVVARPAAAERPANATNGKGIPPSPDYTLSLPPNANPSAPTDNLNRVAKALHLNHKSVTAVLTVQSGLYLTNRVDISALFGRQRVTQTYNNSTGNRLLATFPEGYGRHEEEVIVSLAEKLPDGNSALYAVRFKVDIEALYDLTISPLTFYLHDDCDDFGDSEPDVIWFHPDGKGDEVDFSLAGGETYQIRKFARTLHEVAVSSSLKQLTFAFEELDGFGDFTRPPRPPSRSTERLTIGEDSRAFFTMTAQTDDYCAADFSYTTKFQLLQYPGLT